MDLLVVGHRDGVVRILHASSPGGSTVLELPRHSQSLRAVACAVDDAVVRIATCGDSGIQVLEVDLERLAARWQPPRVPRPRESDDEARPSRMAKLFRLR